ncbi:MAG TPA: MIP/aquaporin family protein [Hyphomonadaceae bacterium]|nr:MIP/aquaporin family protein [Hyphomonadaceae bacterium]HPI49348.1 MIP/aquaporin family protein [Hyphomonadaceae bacterium]
MTPALWRRLAAEALGTLLLVGTVIGSGILADNVSADDGVSLLGNTIATAGMLAVLILALGPVSGAHFNPAVTLVMALRRELPAVDAAAYMLAQCAGAVAGAVLAHAMFALPLIQVATHDRSGLPTAFSDGVATFALVFAILAVRRSRPEAIPYAVALVITAGYWWTASTSFANPAVTLARALTDTFSGIRPADAPGFVLAQIVGALVGMGAYQLLFGPDKRQT